MDNNGHIMNIPEDILPIGMHKQNQNPYDSFSTGDKMRRSSGQSKVFDNNGGNSKAGDAGTINHNNETGPVTFGF